MKTKLKRVSKSALSVILALMMVVSTMVVGMVTVNAAIDGNRVIYFDPSSNTNWTSANARFAIVVQGNSPEQWANLEQQADGKYKATIPSGNWNKLFFCRMNPSTTENNWNNGTKWNQSAEITSISTDVNLFTLNDTNWDNANGTWSTYSGDLPTSCTVYYVVGTGMETYGSVSATVTSGYQVDYNTSVTFTATANDGYSFGGWYSTPECSGTAVSTSNPFTKSITVDTTLYAKFSNVSEVSYVYIKDQAAWSGINAYFWNSSGQVGTDWPGDAMTKLNADGYNNESIYRIAVPDGATKLKFSKTKDNNNTQSGELDVKANQVYNNLSNNWYSFDTSANYSIVGPVDGAADDWSTTTLVSEKVDNYGTYKIDVSISNPTTQGFFRVQRDIQQYGPYNTSYSQADFDITNTNTPATAYEASVDYYTKAFSITNAGNYSIYVRNSYHKDSDGRENRPDVWVVRTGDVSDPTVTYGVSGGNGTLTATANGSTIASGAPVTPNTEVTFTATPNDGYEVEGWYSDAACTEAYKISPAGTNKTYSVTVNSDTTVYVKFKASTVTPGGGTLSDRYFFISTSEGHAWNSDSMPSIYQAYYDSNYYYITFTVQELKTLTNNNIKSNLYFALSSSQSLDNLYHLNESFNDNKWNAINETTESCNIEKKYNYNNHIEKNVSFVRLQITDENVTSVTLKYKYNNASDYIVTAETSSITNDTVKVIAKDATLRTGDYYSTLHQYGDTYFYTEDSEGKTYCTSGTTTISNKMSFTREEQKSVAAVSLDEVKKGTTLHIETKNVKDDYYVAGYVVNGETLALFNQDEIPVLDYTIPYDTAANTKIEITPVYFAKDSSNCVTFYVEGFDSTVQETWGNTIACYPYYSGAASQDNAFSTYPGQPMLYKDGKYFIQVPRKFNNKEVVGMTLNNYKWDDVHGSINSKENAQTYDYDDFVRIADKMVDGTYIADNIIFSFKFRKGYDNFGYKTDDSKESPSTISYATFAGGNGWENLTDHNGNLVNIFGTQLFKTTDVQYSEKSTIEDDPTNNEHLLIVSNGYDENYQGYYATEWTIYAYKDSAYKKVAQIPSSALILSYDEVAKSKEESKDGNYTYASQLNSYKTAYELLNTEEYKNLPAYITYEKNDKQSKSNDDTGGNEGFRCDGRWYYSRINDEIISNVKIQYADNLAGPFTDDPFVLDTNKGTTTNANAYFTNSTAYGNTTCEGKIGKGNFDITTTYSGSTYMFVGWYLEKEGVYTKLTNSTNASIEMTGSETYVARYVKVPEGSINISHSLFSNVSETAAKGAGTLGLQVTLSYNDGTYEFNQPYTYNTSDSSVSTNVLLSDVQLFYNSVLSSVGESSLKPECFSIKVSLSSIPADNTSIKNAYVENYKDSGQSYLSFTDNATDITTNLEWTAPLVGQSMEISIPFNKIFTGPNNTSITDKVEFFSEFETNPISYEITYNFKTRLYGEKQYKKSGNDVSVGTDGLIPANGTYSFTNAYIMSKAPDESNFMKTFNWDEASIKQSYDSTNHTLTVTVNSKQVDRTVYATINFPGFPDEEAKNISTAYGGHFKENGEFVMAPAKNNDGQDFSYWKINTVEDAFVANCYSQYFNYVGYDDYIVTAVYGQGKNTDIYDDTDTSTTVTFLEYSRNHWNDYDSKNNPHPADAPHGSIDTEYDRLYADFALAFNYNGILLNETDDTGLKLGYVLDVTGESTVENLKTNILANSNDSSFKIDGNNVLNYSIDKTDLDNKNRVECYYGIKNTDTNRRYNIKVYSYMIVGDNVTLSEEPITICYNGAIKEYGGNDNET